MKLSYVIVTRNRRDVLMSTLARLEECTHLPRRAWEVLVVDNASDDDTPQAVAKAFRGVRVIRLAENEGMPARNHAFGAARGRYVALLDDDSYPTGQAIPMSVAYLDRNARAAAVVGRVVLPSGALEAPALPSVLLGGASVVRKAVLEETGGFSPEFFRQAEEYDLTFRILARGWRVDRFEDVVFRHEKVPGGRTGELTHRMDVRNNLILVERFLPPPARRAYRHDWIRRYVALARHDGHADAARRGLCEAVVWARRERSVGRQTLPPAALEAAFGFEAQARRVAQWCGEHQVRRAAIADFGKNIYATYAACRSAGVELMGLVDDRPAFRGMRYRGLSLVNPADVGALGVDGVVVANVNPAQVDTVAERVRQHFKGPVLTLWTPRRMDGRDDQAPPAESKGVTRAA